MSLIDKFCMSIESKEDRKLCYRIAEDLEAMITDMGDKGLLRSELKVKKGEEDRKNFLNVMENVRNVGHSFNTFFGTKDKMERFFKHNKMYSLGELLYLYYSNLISIFLQNVEEFRVTLLFIMKLPVTHSALGKNRIKDTTGLGNLLKKLKKIGIKKVDILLEEKDGSPNIDYDLRNKLSHCLFWFDKIGGKPYLYYSNDGKFKNVKKISVSDLHIKTRRQAIYTKCLLHVIPDWFQY